MTTAAPSRVTVVPVTGYTGAEIRDVDLSQPMDEVTYQEIRNALNVHGVIFFRGQELTPQQYLDFGARFGEVSVSKALPTVPGFPQINLLVREPEKQKFVVGEDWHADQSYRDRPTFGTILYGREVPAWGGDTAYINMAAVYDSLSDGLKETLEGLRGVHVHAFNQKRIMDPEAIAKRPEVAVHPVVTVHPETGRKSLYVSPTYTERFEGWSAEESAPLLNYIYQQALKPQFGCRFHWEKGSIAFWDNRTVWHNAINDYSGVRREMHRLVVG